ncbi:unnamed protein product [Didymodactylos carnosus]|uniref:NAD(P)(+)--arginine ADP-ribosyltransferase n=1 Tax=Didymodactylos carnosus TaxID=1234261 RepID=A0A815RGX5_9BILA|nr:unnamed protein product [Didymodactylos carnosus]CAF1477257.1 unnamed protein product [Didymodactylos carnosus]CAF4118666.1 unnamed protein product [Didymodactylos carnosus]CAF4343117.1 unnamed protein product [Didymodactylos carnosus]
MFFYRFKNLFFRPTLNDSKSTAESTSSSRRVPGEIRPEEEQQNMENDGGEEVTLIWFDKYVDHLAEEDVQRTKQRLQEINNYFLFFTEQDAFLDYLRMKETEKILAVVGGSSMDAVLLDHMHSLSQVDAIFLLYTTKDDVDEWSDKYTKLMGCYKDQSEMLDDIEKNVKMMLKQTAAFSLYDQKQKATRDLTSESGSFLFFQLFKDVLLNMEMTDTAKQEMITKCSGYYRNNRKELRHIELFATTYKAVEAIEWYTKESFVFRLVNKALRTEDIEALYTFRFYVVDLCRRLSLKHKELIERQENLGEPILKLYRGLQLPVEEINSMQRNVGSLISQNGFLSTSRSRKVAQDFALTPTTRPNVLPALFEISANVSQLKTIVLADIAEYSAFPFEEEVLFDLGMK